MQVHFKWSIISSWDVALLSSFQKVIKKSIPKSPLRCSRDSVVHNSRHLSDKEYAGSHFAINKLLESQIITLLNSSLTSYSWLIIKQHSIDVMTQRRLMALRRLDGLNPGKLQGSTDWQLTFSPDATTIIAEMTLNSPTSQIKCSSTAINAFPVLKFKVYFNARVWSLYGM